MTQKLRYILILIISIFTIDFLGTNFFQYSKSVFFSKDNMFKDHEIYHHELKKNYSGKGHKNEIIYTNKYGLIKSKDEKEKKLNDKSNILFLGDSFTQGAGINYEKTFASLASKKLKNKKNIINLSAVSYSPSIYYYKTIYFIEKYNLDFSEVYLFLDISDPYDEQYRYDVKNDKVVDNPKKDNMLKNLENPLINSYFDEITYSLKKFITDNTTITFYFLKITKDIIIKKDKDKEAFFKKYGFIINHQANLWTFDDVYYQREGYKGVEICKKYLEKINEVIKKKNSKLTLVIYSWPGQIFRNDRNIRSSLIWREWTNRNNVNFLDFSNILYENQLIENKKDRLKIIDKFYLKNDMHFNENGHKLFFQEISKYLN